MTLAGGTSNQHGGAMKCGQPAARARILGRLPRRDQGQTACCLSSSHSRPSSDGVLDSAMRRASSGWNLPTGNRSFGPWSFPRPRRIWSPGRMLAEFARESAH